MSTFELIIVVLVFVYVVSTLYFLISGRILTKKKEKKDDDRYENQHAVEVEISLLTERIRAIMAENERLNGVVRSWMAQANDYKVRLDVALKEKEELQKQEQPVVKKRKNTKKGGE